MSACLKVLKAGPGLTVQDQGRPGFLAQGISRGGAADLLALAEGAALLRQSSDHAVIEMAGSGGVFQAETDLLIALTGAPMKAQIDDARVIWNASHLLPAGATLTISGAETGNYGYLHIKGGIATAPFLGARSAHLAAGIGRRLEAGDTLPVTQHPTIDGAGQKLDAEDRFGGGPLRVVPSLQTSYFDPTQRDRFEDTQFAVDPRSNRMGISLAFDGEGFNAETGLSILSEIIVPGDIQITGDGTPYILMSECQTTGGYPRMAAVIPADLPRVAQTRAGEHIRFQFITLTDAVEIERKDHAAKGSLKDRIAPLIRDPHHIADLLSYQLISGVTAGDDDPEDQDQ